MRSDASALKHAGAPTAASAPDPDDLDAPQQLNVRLRKMRINQIKRLAALRGVTMAEYLDGLVAEDVQREQDALRRTFLEEQARVRRELAALEDEVAHSRAGRSPG